MFNSLLSLSRLILVLLATLLTSPLMAASWTSFAPVQEALQESEPLTEGLKLDLPMVSEDGSSVPLEVRFDASLPDGDYLKQLQIFATKNPNAEVIDFHFYDQRLLPQLATRIRLNETQTVIAVATSRSGQTWVTEQEVRVTVSGCLIETGADERIRMENPRVALPRRLAQGQPAEIRTLINHPMETGLREDAQGQQVEQNLVKHLQVNLDGEAALRADFHTGTSANPYVRLAVSLAEEATAEFIWQDQQGQTLSEERSLTPR